MFKFINPKMFFLAFFIGFILMRFTGQPTETVLVYPTPDNAGKMQYVDNAGTCFVYNSKNVECPKKGYKKIPIQ